MSNGCTSCRHDIKLLHQRKPLTVKKKKKKKKKNYEKLKKKKKKKL